MSTTFRRQLTAMICLLLGAILLLGVSFWVLFNRYAAEEKESSLNATADSVEALVQAYSANYPYNWDFRINLSVAAAASENDILICSLDGTVHICSGQIQSCKHVGETIGGRRAQLVRRDGSQRADAEVSRIYEESRIAVARLITAEDGTELCIAVVSLEQASLSELTGRTLRIFIVTALLVILIMILAIPFFTRRETRPIRDMAAAARLIARGNYKVRVPTGHQNGEIEELAVAFNNMSQALESSDTVRQEFVANVSHELKTPMTTIAGYLDGMLDGTIPRERHPYYMELVAREARRLSRLVRNMLDVARLQDQGIPPEKMTDFDICELAGQTLLSFEQRITQKGLNVEFDMPDYGVTVHALMDAIGQVVYNLMDNAVKFADEGGSLWVRVVPQGMKCIVTVGNTGPTIAPQELPLLFDRFHKTDKSRSGDRDGAGLGLYIVKNLVHAHSEDVYVASREGRTEFTFTLPIAK